MPLLLARRACLWAALGLLAALTFGPPPAQAAVTEAWVHRYSNVVSNSNDEAVKVVRDAAGDIIVTGTTDDRIHGPDMLTIKYSGADGSVLWQQRYNGPANGDDHASAVAVDGSGNVVVTGSSDTDYYTAKYAAADGALLWEHRYNGPGNYYDSPSAMAVDGSGNVVVTGYSWGGTNGYTDYSDYYTVKYAAADGALLWEKRYNGPASRYDSARAVAVDASGNVVVTGSSDNGAPNYYADYYTAKYAAADGALLWEKRYNGPGSIFDQGNAVAVDGGGNVVVTGASGGSGRTSIDYYTAKYAAADGALLWEKRYRAHTYYGYSEAQAVAVDGSGNVVVTGFSDNSSLTPDYYTAKYAAADGALLWEKRYNGPDNAGDFAQAVAMDSSGNVVVTGISVGSGGTAAEYYTAKYAAADGALLWEKRYHGPGDGYDRAFAVAVDSSGNVVVTGFSGNYPNWDYYTAKYAAVDGALLWEKRYNGLANGDDSAQAVAVDGNGNVIVTGSSQNANFNTDYYTAKYAADGALLWEQRYNGPANSDDRANALAVDDNGNVVVTGSTDGSGDSYANYSDYYTAKYAAADGALLWEKRYNGPANKRDQPQAVAVDASGNVVVTGISDAIFDCYDCNWQGDYYTAKYAAADGTLLWETHYNGPANGFDYGYAVAVDASGNVVVTGLTDSHWDYYGGDYYTAKYAAADGALLWEKRYNGTANDHDRACAVAVDGSGNVVVTGTSYNTNFTNPDYYTAKYAAANGALLWEQRYNGPANSDDHARAVAVDASGNVVVTGSSVGTNYSNDYYTAKYAAVDGALLWEKLYNGPANYEDLASAVAVDGSGNVVVTGYSWNGTNTDYYTAKYAAADGALLWEKRYNGGAASSLALGPNGMVAVTGSSFSDYATIVYRENLPPVSIALVPTGVRIRFTGVPGRSYTIERAPGVTGPWTTLATPTAPIGGLIEYVDTNAPMSTAFYRTSTP